LCESEKQSSALAKRYGIFSKVWNILRNAKATAVTRGHFVHNSPTDPLKEFMETLYVAEIGVFPG